MRLIARTIGALLKCLYQHHNILIVLWAFGTMAALAGISGYWMFYRAAYALGALIPSVLCGHGYSPAGWR